MFTNQNLKKLSIALCFVASVGFAGCGSSNSSSNQPQQKQVQQTKEPAKQLTLQEQGLQDPNATISQKNALKKAILYAKDMHMSKAKVYHQLTSEYGEKFPVEDAQWAVSRLSDIDWKANALAKAKNYQTEMSMSVDRIHQQLLSEHGEQFTQEEADYALANLPK